MNRIRQRPETVANDLPGRTMSERIIEGLRIHIDRDLCVSFGDCIEAAPEVFEFDDDEIAVFVSETREITRKELIEACASCPVDALTAFDEEGEQLAP
jgi:ferredoxin